jgi:hypothetical protein
VVVSALAAAAVLIPFIGSVYPAPPFPENLLIYIFAGLMAAGFVWLTILKARRPGIVAEIERHLAETYARFAVERQDTAE